VVVTQILTLPLPPSTNALHVGMGKSRRKSPGNKAWFTEAGIIINIDRAKKVFQPLGPGWYRTRIYWPAEDKADADNRTKSLHDILHTMGVTPDDKWLWGSSQERSWDVGKGTCVVEFWTVTDEETAPPLATRLCRLYD